MPSESSDVLVIGGGPAGLRAAEIISRAGLKTILADRMPSVGRKLLVAGHGGLNLTHAEPVENFPQRYGSEMERWPSLLADFSPADLRAWVEELGIETFVGTSRRVFPVGKQAAPLLRRWVERLRKQGVDFRLRHRLSAWRPMSSGGFELDFATSSGHATLRPRAVVLAFGGASWPQTGSDGEWVKLLAQHGVGCAPLVPANCGYERAWPAGFLAQAEGRPLKNVVVRAGDRQVAGELLVTRYGLEGGALYPLIPVLRSMPQPSIWIDLKPSFTADGLWEKIRAMRASGSLLDRAARAWKLGPVARALLEVSAILGTEEELVRHAKALPLALDRPRPIAEAISSAGGVPWDELTDDLMLKRFPGLFCAGEMIDWEAPTGGYLLQGCLATGTRAGRGVLRCLKAPEAEAAQPQF